MQLFIKSYPMYYTSYKHIQLGSLNVTTYKHTNSLKCKLELSHLFNLKIGVILFIFGSVLPIKMENYNEQTFDFHT